MAYRYSFTGAGEVEQYDEEEEPTIGRDLLPHEICSECNHPDTWHFEDFPWFCHGIDHGQGGCYCEEFVPSGPPPGPLPVMRTVRRKWWHRFLFR